MKNIEEVVRSAVEDSKLIEKQDDLTISLLIDQLKLYKQELDELSLNGSTITVQGSNGYDVTKQNPSFVNMQQCMNQIKDLMIQLGLMPKARAAILKDIKRIEIIDAQSQGNDVDSRVQEIIDNFED